MLPHMTYGSGLISQPGRAGHEKMHPRCCWVALPVSQRYTACCHTVRVWCRRKGTDKTFSVTAGRLPSNLGNSRFHAFSVNQYLYSITKHTSGKSSGLSGNIRTVFLLLPVKPILTSPVSVAPGGGGAGGDATCYHGLSRTLRRV